MKRTSSIATALTALIALAWTLSAHAEERYFDQPPDGSIPCATCHGAVKTCAGCHAHGTHDNDNMNSMNVQATTDKAVYAPGETVMVSITGGYRDGWVRVKLWDQDCNAVGCLTGGAVAVARNTCSGCPFGFGGVDGITSKFPGPVTLTYPAPSAPGTYTWSASWYGHQFDMDQMGGSTTFGNLWLLDPFNFNHGDEITTFTFEVQGGGNLAPVALDDLEGGAPAATTPVNTAVSVDVLGNDTDGDGDTLTVYGFDNSSANGGLVSCSLSATTPDTQCTLTPAANTCGLDSFTYDATDGLDVSNRATVSIRVGDANAPFVMAPADLTVTLAAGESGPVPASHADITAWLGAATANDPEEGSGLVVTNNAPASFPVGTTPVTFSATDGCRNTGTATANVIVELADNSAPIVNAPPPLSVTAAMCAASVSQSDPQVAGWLASATATDPEDGTLTVTHNAPPTLPIGDTDVTFSATDSLGTTGTASSTVTVLETPNSPPTLSAPAPITILVPPGTTSLPASNAEIAAFLSAATASDDEDGSLDVTNDAPDSFPLGITTVTFSTTDACSVVATATSTVTIQEQAGNSAPVLTAPEPITVTADLCAISVPATHPDIDVFLSDATATDAEDGNLSAAIGHDAPASFPTSVGPGSTTTVTFSVTDSGNPTGNAITTTATSTVTAIDPNAAPSVTAPAPLTLTIPAGTGSAPASDPAIAAFLASATADDAQDGSLSTSNDAPASFALGSTTVTFTATDSCGALGSDSSTVTIQEETQELLDIDVFQFRTSNRATVARGRAIDILLMVRNYGTRGGEVAATVTGMQDGVEVYSQTIMVSDTPGQGPARFEFPAFAPGSPGMITWTVSIADDDPDEDTATATTLVD